jgi:uncharacterized protein YodC (DUF2158 family)
MADQRFKAGDVVRLKSGGPKMTVIRYGKFNNNQHETLECQWFDAQNVLKYATFEECVLQPEETAGPVRLQRA